MPPTKTLSQLWSTSSIVLVLAVASAALAWRDCMLLALSMVLAYRLFPLQMDRGAPWRAIAAAVHVISAGLLAAGAGVALLVGVAAAGFEWWQPTAGHPGELLVILIMGSAWCCLSGRGHQAVAEEIRFWVVLFVGAIGARELHVSGWTGAPCVFVSVVGMALIWRGWRLATVTSSTLLRAGSESR